MVADLHPARFSGVEGSALEGDDRWAAVPELFDDRPLLRIPSGIGGDAFGELAQHELGLSEITESIELHGALPGTGRRRAGRPEGSARVATRQSLRTRQ